MPKEVVLSRARAALVFCAFDGFASLLGSSTSALAAFVRSFVCPFVGWFGSFWGKRRRGWCSHVSDAVLTDLSTFAYSSFSRRLLFPVTISPSEYSRTPFPHPPSRHPRPKPVQVVGMRRSMPAASRRWPPHSCRAAHPTQTHICAGTRLICIRTSRSFATIQERSPRTRVP
jgi:hypothetical protein